MAIVKPHHANNYLSNRMGIPAFDDTQMLYTGALLSSVIYSLGGVAVAQVNYTYNADDDIINITRVS
jgi:hypothetical protein|tara:strand:+ start:502 stop:702 length:201 start_codon:yes stop_codon:yes gene_type:complete